MRKSSSICLHLDFHFNFYSLTFVLLRFLFLRLGFATVLCELDIENISVIVSGVVDAVAVMVVASARCLSGLRLVGNTGGNIIVKYGQPFSCDMMLLEHRRWKKISFMVIARRAHDMLALALIVIFSKFYFYLLFLFIVFVIAGCVYGQAQPNSQPTNQPTVAVSLSNIGAIFSCCWKTSFFSNSLISC